MNAEIPDTWTTRELFVVGSMQANCSQTVKPSAPTRWCTSSGRRLRVAMARQ